MNESQSPQVPPVLRFISLLQSDLPKLIIAGQLSTRTSFQISVEGPFDKAEREALRTLLDAQIAVLEMP